MRAFHLGTEPKLLLKSENCCVYEASPEMKPNLRTEDPVKEKRQKIKSSLFLSSYFTKLVFY